jgi:hypothetical protein
VRVDAVAFGRHADAQFVCTQVFAEFDTDGSGTLDFDEFAKMLHALGIYLPAPKVVRCAAPHTVRCCSLNID